MTYLEIFREIAQIPRASHHEERIADYLCKFAAERGLDYSRDEHHCVVIRKAASPGYQAMRQRNRLCCLIIQIWCA